MKKPGASPILRQFVNSLYKGETSLLLSLLRREPEIAFDPAALVNACLHGRAEVVEALLEAGADPDAPVPSHEAYRPLHRAIEHRGYPNHAGHPATVRLLLEEGANPELRSTWTGLTALGVAGMAGDAEVIGIVREHGVRENLFTAAILGEDDAVAQALAEDPGSARHPDENGMTPLHYAALSGLASTRAEALGRVAARLLEAGADPDSAPRIGPYASTAVLHFVPWGKNLPVARVLLENGANPDLGFPNSLWKPPGELAELYASHGADVNAVSPEGEPLLHSRIHWNLTSVVLWLLEKGADPNSRDGDGNTPLHRVARRGGNRRITEALLRHGADPDATNAAGLTAAEVLKQPRGGPPGKK
jgi:ankyrin repeat protein